MIDTRRCVAVASRVQERGRRGGTENVLEIVGLGKACEIAARDLDRNMAHLKAMRDRLYDGLAASCRQLRINGNLDNVLPNTLSISFENLEADRMLEEIGGQVAASAGAACHSDAVQVSHVLQAMGVPLRWAKGTLRFSVGKMTTAEEIDRTVEVVAAAARKLDSPHED